MADPQEVESLQAPVEAKAQVSAPDGAKKTARPKKAKAPQKQAPARKTSAKPAAVAAPAPATSGKRRIYSDKERAQKLEQIKKLVAGGDSVKNAVTKAAISEQTYYQWLRAATPETESDDLKDLLALEQENKELKKRLAEHLRKENAELKRKLGMK